VAICKREGLDKGVNVFNPELVRRLPPRLLFAFLDANLELKRMNSY